MNASRLLRPLLIFGVLGSALAARAGLVGSRATGVMNVGGENRFDPTLGHVPPGYLNATQGLTVTVEDPAVEFGYADVFDAYSIDVSDGLITLTDESFDGTPRITFDLTDAAFVGLTFTKTSDAFGGAGVAMVRTGDTLSFTIPFSLNLGTFSATFAATPVPEPASLCALGLGAFAVSSRTARKRTA